MTSPCIRPSRPPAIIGGGRHGAAGTCLPQRRRRDRRDGRGDCSTTSRARTPSWTRSSTSSSTKPTGCWTWASLPDNPPRAESCCRSSGRHCSSRRRLPAPIVQLTKELLQNPATINPSRARRLPRSAITQAIYPVPQETENHCCCSRCSSAARCGKRWCLPRTKHRGQSPVGVSRQARDQGRAPSMATGRSPSAPRRLAGFKDGR